MSRSQPRKRIVAVLASGGLDSAILLAHMSKTSTGVYPLYVRCGLFWEATEQKFLREFISRLDSNRINAVQTLDFPMSDLYGGAWYATGREIPGFHDADEQWEIAGRNIILTAKAAVWCALHSVHVLALGTLASNPFPDATPRFFGLAQRTFSVGLDIRLRLVRPFAGLRKADVVRLGRDLPLEWTLSCARPVGTSHCGTCGKCRERSDAFLEAGVPDPTWYATPPGRG